MAVHAQHAFLPDLQTIRASGNGLKDQDLDSHLVGQQQVLNGAVLGDANSELTYNNGYNAYVSRKRYRDVADAAATIQQFQFPISSKVPKITIAGSADTSTSGRPVLPHPSQHVTEIDALFRLHNAKLRSGLDEIQKRHHAEFLQIFETQAAKRITEKEAEIENLKRKQAELDARLKQVTAENQIWFTVARNSEAVASGLRASLCQALRRSVDGGECHLAGAQAEDAESCCYEGEREDRKLGRLCRLCREREASVLLLPCRHLCLCSECEPVSETCPICYEAKNVGLQVFME